MKIIDLINDHKLWDHLISLHSDATVFHTSAWAKVLYKTYNHKPFYLQFENKTENASTLIPIMEVRSPILGCRGVSLPFSDFCQPLIRNKSNLALIKECIESLAAKRKWKYFELRDNAFSDFCSSSSEEPAEPTFLSHELDLSVGNEKLFENCSSSTRRALRKSEKSQLDVRIEDTENAMRSFFSLHTLTRRRHGLPPQPYSFFQNIHRELISKGLGFIVSAFQQEIKRPIATSVFLTYRDKAIYKFGASDENSWSVRPNNLVMWEGIKCLAESGFKHLHFGRTSPIHDGLSKFKRSWGAQEKAVNYVNFNCRNKSWKTVKSNVETSRISKFSEKIFSHAPRMLNRVAGTLIYPHLD